MKFDITGWMATVVCAFAIYGAVEFVIHVARLLKVQ